MKYKLRTITKRPITLYKEFATRKEAEAFAKHNVSIFPGLDWHDVYEVFEEDTKKLPKELVS